jgi:hypothetical protein
MARPGLFAWLRKLRRCAQIWVIDTQLTDLWRFLRPTLAPLYKMADARRVPVGELLEQAIDRAIRIQTRLER